MKKEKQSSVDNNKQNGSLNKFNFDLNHFVSLDSENKICFDCGGPFPTYVSINNGVFICSNCASNHEKLGFNISYIHKISSPWDPYLLSYAERGGNTRFKRLCLQYEVPCQSLHENDEEKLKKYIIRLGEYNRLLLRSEILAEEPPQQLYFEVAKNPCNLNVIYFPEFQNYHLYQGEVVVPGKTYSIGGKILNGTKFTAGAIGTAGKFAYKVGKPVVCFFGKATYSGIKYVGSSIWNHYTNSDKNENNKTNSQTNGNNNNNVNNNYNLGNNNCNNSGKNLMNEFALVDYSDDDLCKIKTVDLNTMNNKESINVNFNINTNNINNNNYDYNQRKNNGYHNNPSGNINISNHNNIIANDNYLINNGNEFNNININNNNINDSNGNVSNNINIDNNIFGGFEIISQDKDYNNSSNSLFENNSYAGMNVQFENTDKEKARKDANNFLLKP